MVDFLLGFPGDSGISTRSCPFCELSPLAITNNSFGILLFCIRDIIEPGEHRAVQGHCGPWVRLVSGRRTVGLSYDGRG